MPAGAPVAIRPLRPDDMAAAGALLDATAAGRLQLRLAGGTTPSAPRRGRPARRDKPEIPRLGAHGIPRRDELVLTRRL